MRVAAAAWPLERHADWTGYAEKLEAWIAGADADLVVFPEYAGMEPCLATSPPNEPQAWLEAALPMGERVRDLHIAMARKFGRWILAGSLPVEANGGIVNRAWLVSPAGDVAHQDKQIPTPWERAHTTLQPGDPLQVFDTALGRVGVLVCHDAEFPLLARSQDCEVLLIPACTDTPHGAHRVRTAARARALEGACVTVLSQTVGSVSDCVFLDVNRSATGIFAPPDRGFPGDGVLADGGIDGAGWARATVDRDALRLLKDGRGEVCIPQDWTMSEQQPPATPVRLR